MRSLILSCTVLSLLAPVANADMFDLFEDLQPVSTLLNSTSAADLDYGGDTCCTGSTCCTNNCCSAPPAPTMIGASLGVPIQIYDADGYINFPNFISKVSDNNSAIPQDRVFWNYHFFNDVRTYKGVFGGADNKRDLSLHELGIEKRIGNGRTSVDLIVPFSYSPDTKFSSISPGQRTPEEQVQLQNIAFGLKQLLVERQNLAISAGVRVEAPTAEDIVDTDPGFGGRIENETWVLTPYLAVLLTPSEDFFIQMFGSYRMQTGEDGHSGTSFGTPTFASSVREPSSLDLDAQIGYWLYRNTGGQGLTGLQSKLELHYMGSYEPYQPSGLVPGITTITGGEHDYLNLTAGLTALINDKSTLTGAFVVPIRDGGIENPFGGGFGFSPYDSDREFDWGFIFQFNIYLGS